MTNDLMLRKSRVLQFLDSTLISLALWAVFLILGAAYMIGTLRYLEASRRSNERTEKRTADTLQHLTRLMAGYDEARGRQMTLEEQDNRMLRHLLKISGVKAEQVEAITNPEAKP